MLHAEFAKRIFTEKDIPYNYKNALEKLVVYENQGVTIFKGGPLDLQRFGVSKAWLTPILAADQEGQTSFHILHINDDQFETDPVEITLNLASDLSLKLDNHYSSEASRLRQDILESTGRPTTIMRPSITGNITYPFISTPDKLAETEVLLQRAKRVANVIGAPIINSDFAVDELVAERFIPQREINGNILGKPRLISSSIGNLIVYGILAPNDPWKYYELIGQQSVEDMDKSHPLNIRVDSGCDIGQCYHDGGCDCRFQLHKALQEYTSQPGFIIHVPGQDGRGYGMVTKMATEGGKRGIDVGYNHGRNPMNTIEAATELLGSNFDIRTYTGVGELLWSMGFNKVNLITDSKVKLVALQKIGLEVVRIPTGTETGNHCAHNHVRAKHSNSHYFSS